MRVFFSLFQRLGRFSAAALMAGLMAACGGDDVAAPVQQDPLASFAQQKLDWQACDPVMFDDKKNEELTQFGRSADCALMRVPLDYDNPAGAELQIELLRVAATPLQQRLGAIVFNPGGPGGSGLALAGYMGLALMQADDARLQEMANRYDLIGFSPRGTGASNPLICDVAGRLEVNGSVRFENLQTAQHNARVMAEACLNNPMTQHIHTDATARDMDLIRAVLGDSKLNYIGYSYGTELGAWYSRLFPERVGRMLLDSNGNIADSLAWLTDTGLDEERILDQVMLPYAARHNDTLGLGDAAKLRNALLTMSWALKDALFDLLDFRNSSEINRNVLLMSAAVLLDSVSKAPEDADLEALEALAALVKDRAASSSLPQSNETVEELILQLLGKLKEDDHDDPATPASNAAIVQGTDGRMKLLPRLSVLMSVRCNESVNVGDARDWQSRFLVYGGFSTDNFCAYWTLPTRPFPAATKSVEEPLLMLQSRYDGATQVEGAMATLAALPQARMIVVEDEYQHGVFPYGTQCVDRQVADYFLHGTLPQRLSSCAGKPLPADAGK